MHFAAILSPVLLFASLIVPTLSTPFHTHDPGYRTPLPLPVEVIHQFPPGTWLDNLAVRRNGKILTTALSSPELFEVHTHGNKPVKVVHTFANATGCTGITELGRDVFYVIAGQGSFSPNGFSSVRGSYSVYKVDVRHHHPHTTKRKPAKVSLVANFPDSILLDGITVLNKFKKWLLVSDSGAGVVYRLEAKKGKVVKVLEDPLMTPSNPAFGIGVNGMKIKENVLFFTNFDRNILARMFIKDDGRSRSPATVVAHLDSPDDFVFTEAKDLLVAQNGANRLGRVIGDTVTTLAGGPSDGQSELFGPTAIQFGKVQPFVATSKSDWMKVYISTNGGIEQYLTGNLTRGGTISVVDVREYW